MTMPVVAIVGRPNVGKSTLVNRITRTKDAIVHEMRGVTRDRSYHQAEWSGVNFTLIDTGGIEMGSDDRFQQSITDQAFMAADEADVIVMMVDAQTGITADDEEVARVLRKADKPVILTVNKMDNPQDESAIYEFYKLGLGDPFPISASHGYGTGDLLDMVVERLGDAAREGAEPEEDASINVAIIGRPNAGKSSLANKMIGRDRAIVSDVAGTTRDSIDTKVEHDGKEYTIVDTAGLRQKSKIVQDVEYYSYVRAMRAIDRADVALLVVDATLGITDQDQRVAGYADERGCAMIILLNKRDIVESGDVLNDLREDIGDRLGFVGYAPVISISALTGKGVERIWDAIDTVYGVYSSTIPTSKLNVWLQSIRDFGHTVTKGKQVLKLKYMTQTRICPPEFTVFCNFPDIVTDNFKRYLENRLRQTFDLTGTPIRLHFKKTN
jgi:ribosome-associated GTPase EngA